MALRRSKQRLSHYHNTTFDMGYMVPIGMVEMLPGDTFRHSMVNLLRVSPLAKPMMHPVYVHVNCFFVPSRILWDEWEDFITQNDSAAVLPTITLTGSNEGAVDRLGVPPTAGLEINALPVRAYNAIYNEFYRDEQLNTPVSLDQTTLLRASWQKDYFTTCRPNAQQGSGAEQVGFPITGIGIGTGAGTYPPNPTTINQSDGTTGTHTGTAPNIWRKGSDASNAGAVYVQEDGSGFPSVQGTFDINELRAGFAVQRYRERRNRFGDRYVDMLKAMGVNAGDARLQRPERIAGGRSVLSLSEVISTADSGTSDVGDLRGHGIDAMAMRPYKYFAPEYGWMVTIMTVRPKTVYMDSMHRCWTRRDYDDFWSPEFENLGNQAVTNEEIYAPGGNSTTVFGYQSRHNDYRYQPSYVSGSFRTSSDDDWHMARDFTSAPTLNGSFVQCDPTDRVYLALSTQPQIYAMCQHKIMARRLMSQNARNP